MRNPHHTKKGPGRRHYDPRLAAEIYQLVRAIRQRKAELKEKKALEVLKSPLQAAATSFKAVLTGKSK